MEGKVGAEDPDHSDLFSGRCGGTAEASGCGFPLNSVPGCPCKVSCSLHSLLLTGHKKHLVRTSRSTTETEGEGRMLKETEASEIGSEGPEPDFPI